MGEDAGSGKHVKERKEWHRDRARQKEKEISTEGIVRLRPALGTTGKGRVGQGTGPHHQLKP